MNKATAIIAVAVAAAVTGSGWYFISGDDRGAPPVAKGGYLTVEAVEDRIRNVISATGSLKAVSTVAVSSQLSGQILLIHADFNDNVVRGQPLAELDHREFEAKVLQAEAELDMAQENVNILAARLEGAAAGENEAAARRELFAAQIDKATVRVDTAERQLGRARTLAQRGTSSQMSVDDALAELQTATAELHEVRAGARAHEHSVTSAKAEHLEARAELANAQAALPFRRAGLGLAELDLERSTIRAPIAGVLTSRNVEQGQTVAASLDAPTLFTIAGDLAAMEIHANIDETDIGKIALGQSAEFSVDAFSGRAFSAKVTEIRKAAAVIEGVVIYTVVLAVSNADRLLLPGMTATVRIAIDEVGPVLVMPLAALRFAPGKRTAVIDGNIPETDSAERVIWVLVDDNEPQPRRVSLGPDDGRDIAVLDGELKSGELVIVGRVSQANERRVLGIRY